MTPPRYDVGEWQPGDGVFNAAAMATYTVRLADRLEGFLRQEKFVVLLGGECSNLLAPTLALKRLGRYGVVYVDGHSDFRTVDNSPHVDAAGGEALALITGHGQQDLTNLEERGPYTRNTDAVLIGIREDDDYAGDVEKAGIATYSAAKVAEDPSAVARGTLAHFDGLDGFWVHLDVDILDATIMPAVDSPDPGGIDHVQLQALLQPLLAAPNCVGLDVGIFDPDLDPDGRYAAELTDTLVAALS
ncbi:arginase family protein [Kribbella sp. NPDC048928]|uniref:arginase family protein n=1 Tax=Kribbella sp. NPDC048928 TaxID=3364111 RepID=UPI0037245080